MAWRGEYARIHHYVYQKITDGLQGPDLQDALFDGCRFDEAHVRTFIANHSKTLKRLELSGVHEELVQRVGSPEFLAFRRSVSWEDGELILNLEKPQTQA
jgi:hypothetical protein